MQAYDIKSNGRTIAQLYSFIDTYNRTGDKNLFETIIKEIPSVPGIGYMGFKTKHAMEEHLAWAIYGANYGKRTPMFMKSVEMESIKIIEKVIIKCFSLVKSKGAIKIFLFPTFDNYVKERMHGASGFCVFKNTLTVYIHPEARQVWKQGLAHSVCHEYAHAISHDYHEWKTLLDGLVFEGLAEHFREAALNGKPSKWSTAFNKNRARLILIDLLKNMDSTNGNLYKEVFYSKNKKYPMWTGYTVGYYLVEGYIVRKGRNWKKLVKLKPKDIFKESSFSRDIVKK